MLHQTFLHVRGVGVKTERSLWRKGIFGWEELLELGPQVKGLTLPRFLVEDVEESVRRLEARDAHFFAQRLPCQELWRLFPEFRPETAYLDIETNGMWAGQGHVTTIALYDGQRLRTYVRGENLWEFAQDVKGYKVLVTYNGKCFDLPFLRESMALSLDQVHIDLRFLLGGLGYRGGLKGCEKALGMDRGDLEGLDGFFAVLLWKAFLMEGDPRYLETLLAYNVQDVLSLEHLMVRAYNLKLCETPFARKLSLPMPLKRIIPFRPDPDIMEYVRRQLRRLRKGVVQGGGCPCSSKLKTMRTISG